jgi:hypothetical protein
VTSWKSKSSINRGEPGGTTSKQHLTNTTLEHQLLEMQRNYYGNVDPAGANTKLGTSGRLDSAGRTNTTVAPNSLNASQHLKGKLFYQTQVVKKEELGEPRRETAYILNKNMNDQVRTIEQEQAVHNQAGKGQNHRLLQEENHRAGSLENIEHKKM